jgi:hypothetical protein
MLDPTEESSTREVAFKARVTMSYAYKVVWEYQSKRHIEDPTFGILALQNKHKEYCLLGPEESLFLLAFRAEDDCRSLYKYV